MKHRVGMRATGLVGAIVVALTLAAFFLLDFERTTIHWWALAFLLLSEVLLFSGLIAVRFAGGDYGKLFLRAGLSTTLVLYFAFTLVSVLFVGLFQNLNRFILLQLAIVALFAIITVAVLAFSRKIPMQEEASLDSVDVTAPKRGGF